MLGLVVGVALMFGFFTSNTFVALLGFGIMVASMAGIVAISRRRTVIAHTSERGLMAGIRRRWRGR